jgi:hypothetical protein
MSDPDDDIHGTDAPEPAWKATQRREESRQRKRELHRTMTECREGLRGIGERVTEACVDANVLSSVDKERGIYYVGLNWYEHTRSNQAALVGYFLYDAHGPITIVCADTGKILVSATPRRIIFHKEPTGEISEGTPGDAPEDD